MRGSNPIHINTHPYSSCRRLDREQSIYKVGVHGVAIG